jgi:uncharacterized membrane protein
MSRHGGAVRGIVLVANAICCVWHVFGMCILLLHAVVLYVVAHLERLSCGSGTTASSTGTTTPAVSAPPTGCPPLVSS